MCKYLVMTCAPAAVMRQHLLAGEVFRAVLSLIASSPFSQGGLVLNEYNLNAITNSKGGISKTFEGVYPSRRVFFCNR